MFASSTQPLTVIPSESQAQVYIDGQLVGQGTVTQNVKRNRSHSVMAKVDGRTGVAHVGSKISTTGVLDLVGGFLLLVPFIGIAGPGFKELDQDLVSVAIPPAP